MERSKNSESLFISPKNGTQVYTEDVQDEKDALKPKANKNFLQLPTRKNNFFFQSMKNLSTSKDTSIQNSKDEQINQKSNRFIKQNTSVPSVQQKIESIPTITTTGAIDTQPNETQRTPLVMNEKLKLKLQERRDSPMHLDPLTIYSPNQMGGRNSLMNASILSGEKSKRRISNFQKNLFQKKVKNEDEFGGGPNGLGDKTYQQSDFNLKNVQTPMISSINQKQQNLPNLISGESEVESHISSTLQKGRSYSNQRRGTEFYATTTTTQSTNTRKSTSSTKRKWNFVKKLGLVRKFIDKLQAQSSVYLFSRLTKQHVVTINDKAYVLGDESQISIFSFMVRIATQYAKSKYWLQPFSPDSGILIYLSIFFLCAYTFLIYCVPLYVVFSFDDSLQESLLGRIIPLTILFFDILAKCNTSYYKQGNIVNDRKKIFRNYVKKYLLYDLLIIISFCYTQSSTILHLVILFKLKDLISIEELIHQKFFISQNIQSSYTLIKLLYVDLFLAHIFSCGFIFVAKLNIRGVNWISENKLENQPWVDQYVNSLYFSIITMTTVGFGDIHPFNNLEKIYVSIVTIISSGIFGYTLSVIGGIMHERFQKEAEYKQRIILKIFNENTQLKTQNRRKKYDLNHYMSMRSITKSLQLKALKYLDYIKHKDDQQPLRGQDIVYHLSDDLQKQIKRDFYGTILNQFKILNFNFSPQCLSDLALRMQESYYGPGEIIYSQNDLDDRIFFVAKGRVELYTETALKAYPYEIITKGQAFGKDQFFGQPLLSTSAKSVSFSLVVHCSQIDFKEVLISYPEDYEKYCMMKDNLIVNCKPFQSSCLICKKLYHTISNCPLMHHVRKKEFIVHRYIHSEPMERKEYEKRRQDKFNSLKEIKLIKRDLKRCRQDFIKIAKERKLNHKINSFSSTSSSSSVLSSCTSDENEKKQRNRYMSTENEDRQFYLKNPKIVCLDGSIQIDTAYSDILSESMSLSDYNHYFQNLDQADQIIKINGVETIQEEKSIYNTENDQSSYLNQNFRRRSAVHPVIQFSNHHLQPERIPDQYLQKQIFNEFDLEYQKTVKQNQKNFTNISLEYNETQNKQENENTEIESDKAAIGSQNQFETPINNKLIKQQQLSPQNTLKDFEKKETLYQLQQQYNQQQQDQQQNQDLEQNHKENFQQQQSLTEGTYSLGSEFSHQASHKEPLLNFQNDNISPTLQNKHFNTQLSVKNVNNPSKFYKKEKSLRNQNGVPISHPSLPQSAQQSSQFSLSSLNDANFSPQHINGIESSKQLSPLTKNNNSKIFFTNRPISSLPKQQNNIPLISGLYFGSSGSGEFSTHHGTRKSVLYQNQPLSGTHQQQQQQQYQIQQNSVQNQKNNDNGLFGVGIYNFRKPFLDRPARINIKKQTMLSDFHQGLYSEVESTPHRFSFINPQIAQIKAGQQLNRRESYFSTNINNTTLANNSRRGTIGGFSSTLNQTAVSKKFQEFNNNNNDEFQGIPLIKNISIFSPKNGGSGNNFRGNSLLIPGTPISQIPKSIKQNDISQIMKNISPMHLFSSQYNSNLPRYGSISDENNNIFYDHLQFIPLELDTIKEYKKYFPEGNFSVQFKEKIKIIKLLTRKYSNNVKENPNLKKIIQKKLSKINSMSQKRSFLKQSSKFSGLSMQNNLNIPDVAHSKSPNITPIGSMNGIK